MKKSKVQKKRYREVKKLSSKTFKIGNISKQKSVNSKKVTDLNAEEAKWFFRDSKNYVNFDLPFYFDFKNLLTVASAAMLGKNFHDICKKTGPKKQDCDNPCRYEGVNYTVLGNKDGSFGWRPFQLINPILYVDLINLITEKNNWDTITNRFKDFKIDRIDCISIPRVSQSKDSHKASQVSFWWEEIEQRSIKMALKYDYVFTTDIVNCYPSIYTHSIEWALTKGGKEQVKKDRANSTRHNSLGAEIDRKMQNMNSGQTNGIPQGSTLMDFIAEIVLGYADLKLIEILEKEIPKEDFHILRYRDDYKIFANNPVIGRIILKHLNNVLYNLNMKMSAEKTTESGDVISSSVKREKLERIFIAPFPQGYQKEALRIYQISKKYPNAGLVIKELNIFYDTLMKSKNPGSTIREENTNIDVLISIFSMIALNSPKVINWVSAIISKLLGLINDNTERIKIIEMIHKKFKNIPHTSLIDIWLQRISAPLGVTIPYDDKITKLALGNINNSGIWECSWLSANIVKLINIPRVSSLVEKLESNSLPTIIPRSEVELFKINYDL